VPTATSYGTAQNKTAAATVTITTTGAIPAGTLLVVGVCADNVGGASPTISSITAVGGGTWTNQAGAVTGSGQSTSAGSGVFVYCQTLYTTSIVNSGTVITVTFNASPAAKAVALWGFDQMGQYVLRGFAVSALSTTGSPSVTTAGTALVAGDLVIGIVGTENSAIATGDSDTLNGSWSAINGIATTGGSANTNTSIAMQYKEVTATGAQTFNPTGGVADTVAIVFALVRANVAPTARTLDVAFSPPSSAVLTWTANSAAFPTPTYQVFRSTDGSSFSSYATGQPDSGSYTDTGLVTGQQYWYYIVGSNTAGSAQSNTPANPVPLKLANSLDGGTDGVAISPANSGGGSGDAFTSFSGGGFGPTYSNLVTHRGALAMRTTPGGNSYVIWSVGATRSPYCRFYLYIPTGSLPPATVGLIANGVAAAVLSVSATGALVSGTATSTNTVPLDQWVRIEMYGPANGNNITRLFLSPEATSPTETITNSAVSVNYTNVAIGPRAATLPGPWYLDDLAISEVDWLGPLAAPPVPRNIHLSNAALQPAFTR
jgi:hypothetical protein